MANLSLKSDTEIVRDQVAAIQGANAGLLDFSDGSILRAFVEAVAAIAGWLQGLIVGLLQMMRASTAEGEDLDTWVEDYGVTRLAATYAQGAVTFARFTTGLAALVPIGAAIESSDGSQAYAVTIDTSNPAYDSVQGGYVIAPNEGSVTVLVKAQVAGLAGNAAPGSVTVLATPITGVDTVTNSLSFSGGAEQETDVALRTRFIAYIANLARATPSAIGFAISSVAPSVTYTLTENYTYAGVYQPGYFYVVVDDGTGAPSGGFLTSVAAAIETVRPATSTYGVFGPTLVTVGVTALVTVDPAYSASAVKTAVQAAIVAYLNALPLGVGLSYTRLLQVAYDASPGVKNVTNMLVNAGTADIAATAKTVLRAGVVTIS